MVSRENEIQVRLGSSFYNRGGTLVTVNRVVVHPSYNPSTNANDIALLKMTSTVRYGATIGPVCLPAAGSTFDEQFGLAAG